MSNWRGQYVDRSGKDGEVQGFKGVIAVANTHVYHGPAPVPETSHESGNRGGNEVTCPGS